MSLRYDRKVLLCSVPPNNNFIIEWFCYFMNNYIHNRVVMILNFWIANRKGEFNRGNNISKLLMLSDSSNNLLGGEI